MEPQIKFRAGERQPFIATRNFSLGATGATIPKGGELAFDGSIVEYGGQEYSFPQLRGAIRANWVVPATSYDEMDPTYGRPERANIQVRHATQGGNPMAPAPKMAIATVENDEREVMNARQHAAQTAATNKNYVRGNPVNVVTPGETVRTKHGFEVVEQQDGVEVPGRTMKTAAGERAKQERTTLTAESARLALQRASDVTIEAGRGITQDEMLERMTEEQRELYLAEHASLKGRYVDEPQRTVVATMKKAPNRQTEGMTLKNDIGHGIEIADPTGLSTGKPRESVIVEDGMTFRNTNGPARHNQPAPSPREVAAQEQRTSVNGTADFRRQIAKMVCADFPSNYDFSQPVKKRMARLQADYEDRPDVIKAVFAAESDDMKAMLVQEFPSAFGG